MMPVDLIEPAEPNALKFERFIFDLLPHAKNPLVVEYAEEEVFAPLKNAPGAERDTPEYVQRFMMAQHRKWLEAAGTRVAERRARGNQSTLGTRCRRRGGAKRSAEDDDCQRTCETYPSGPPG